LSRIVKAGMGESAGRPRLLLTADEVLVRDLVKQGSKRKGSTSLPVSSGAQAIAALQAHSDFVGLVTDVNFGAPPAGWEVAVRARELKPTIAVLFVTGDSAQSGVLAARHRALW